MNVGKTLFAQVMDFVPWTSFSRIVHRYASEIRGQVLPFAINSRPTLAYPGGAVSRSVAAPSLTFQ